MVAAVEALGLLQGAAVATQPSDILLAALPKCYLLLECGWKVGTNRTISRNLEDVRLNACPSCERMSFQLGSATDISRCGSILQQDGSTLADARHITVRPGAV